MILRKRQRKSKIKNLCVRACYADCACPQMRRKSWFLELVLLVVFSALLSTADGSFSTGKFQVKGLFNIFVSLCLIDSGGLCSRFRLGISQFIITLHENARKLNIYFFKRKYFIT